MKGGRRERALKLASALTFLAIVAVAVLIVVTQSQSGGGDAGDIQGSAEVDALLRGIPQTGLRLGKASALVNLIEFGDLQCTHCKAASEDLLPPLIEGPVRRGEASIDFHNFTIIGAESVPAGAAAIAAGAQGRGWNFVELFYRNQGQEESGYVTGEFLTAIARHAGIPNIARWNRERKSKAALEDVKAQTAEAQRLGFTGTPSFAIEGPRTDGLETLGLPSSAADLEAAITAATG